MRAKITYPATIQTHCNVWAVLASQPTAESWANCAASLASCPPLPCENLPPLHWPLPLTVLLCLFAASKSVQILISNFQPRSVLAAGGGDRNLEVVLHDARNQKVVLWDPDVGRVQVHSTATTPRVCPFCAQMLPEDGSWQDAHAQQGICAFVICPPYCLHICRYSKF